MNSSKTSFLKTHNQTCEFGYLELIEILIKKGVPFSKGSKSGVGFSYI